MAPRTIGKLVFLSVSTHASRCADAVRVVHCGRVVGPADSPHVGCPGRVTVVRADAAFTCHLHFGTRNVPVEEFEPLFMGIEEASHAA